MRPLRRMRNRVRARLEETVLGAASEVYREGMTTDELYAATRSRLEETSENRPLLSFLLRVLDELLPILLELLKGWLATV